ncbi:hypothetical protein GCM10009801_06090 [Streptomyces albiaxialis]|uniref:Secreted protein n=1 Tax=Streptomyces albiaxialis TaxID=329523 RepID=A0ABN2VHU8_9ACTN
MPRGRHRHSPPLHRLLSPVAVAAAALVCAGGSWLVGESGVGDAETVVLRGLTAAAAAAAVTGAVLLRRWDRAAGRRVGDLKAQQASTAWRAEERQAELEGENEDLRERRGKLESKVRDKRAELARLRSEHADLLRRYANAETERARALEGRRQLEIEAAEPAKALTVSATDHRLSSGAPTPLTYLQANEALNHLARNADRQRAHRKARTAPATPVVPRPLDPDGSHADTSSFDFFGLGTTADPADDKEPEKPEEPAESAEPAEDVSGEEKDEDALLVDVADDEEERAEDRHHVRN